MFCVVIVCSTVKSFRIIDFLVCLTNYDETIIPSWTDVHYLALISDQYKVRPSSEARRTSCPAVPADAK